MYKLKKLVEWSVCPKSNNMIDDKYVYYEDKDCDK